MQNIETVDLSIDQKLKEYKEILDLFNERKISLTKNYISAFEELLTAFRPIKEKAIEENRKTSCNFNPLCEFVKLNETMHSKMLAYLLNPYAGHGQKDLFLQPFLKIIGIADPEKGEWVVTAEKDRVDIILKRREPNSIVIIENKSNGAVDQPNQIYRYWHKEMFRNSEYKDDKLNIIKLYIYQGDESKTPCSNSLEKPQYSKGYDLIVTENEHENLPSKIPLKYNYLTFDDHIVELLVKCIEQLPKENQRLREFVEQYLEIWN